MKEISVSFTAKCSAMFRQLHLSLYRHTLYSLKFAKSLFLRTYLITEAKILAKILHNSLMLDKGVGNSVILVKKHLNSSKKLVEMLHVGTFVMTLLMWWLMKGKTDHFKAIPSTCLIVSHRHFLLY